MAEALALFQGLQLAKSQGINEIIVIGDSRLVIQALLISSPPSQLNIHHLIKKLQILATSFQKIDYFHVLRKHNTKADQAMNFASCLDKGILVLNDTSSYCHIP